MLVNKGTAIRMTSLLMVPYEAHHVPTYHQWMQSKETRRRCGSESLSLNEEYSMQANLPNKKDRLTFIVCLPVKHPSTMAPKNKGKALAATPRKRLAAQMSGSPESQAPGTPTPSGAASSVSRSRTVRPYRSPSVEDEVEDAVAPEPEALKDERTVLGWKLANRCEVPESAGRLRAGSRACCVKCAHTYFNFPSQMCWVPSGMTKCADCLRGNHPCVPFVAALEALQLAADALLDCWADDEDAGLDTDSAATTQAIADLREAQRVYSNAVTSREAAKKKKRAAAAAPSVAAPSVAGPSVAAPSVAPKVVVRDMDDPRQALLHHAESLVELDKAKTEGLKAATQAFNASVAQVLDGYQSGLQAHVDALKFI
ncbi:hypothetical protein VE04_09538 [Pseudogymnoascus sp. 24MN13]|nr:hypothetical protein VE04_09538 [Pseudogymnoascus sp. 24MN13]